MFKLKYNNEEQQNAFRAAFLGHTAQHEQVNELIKFLDEGTRVENHLPSWAMRVADNVIRSQNRKIRNAGVHGYFANSPIIPPLPGKEEVIQRIANRYIGALDFCAEP